MVALIITIIVLLLLSVVTIKILINSGVIEIASESTIIQELRQAEEQVRLKIEEEKINKVENKEVFNITDYTSLGSFNPKIENKYSEYIRIENGEIYLITTTPEKIKKAGKKIGIIVKEKITNVRIYGNSVQEGTPTPDNPIEVQSVGEKTKNLFNINDLWEKGYQNNVSYEQVKMITIPIKNGIYKVSTNCINNEDATIATVFAGDGVDSLLHFTSNKNGVFSNRPKTITITTGIMAIGIRNKSVSYLTFTKESWNNEKYWIQVEDGSTMTEYEPFGYKIPIEIVEKNDEITKTNIYLDEPLRKVGTSADYIDFTSGKVVRNIEERVLNGTEGFFYYTSGTRWKGFAVPINNMKKTEREGFCNYYYQDTKASYVLTCWLGVSNNYFYVLDEEKYNQGLDNFKQWLANLNSIGKSLKITYKLNEEKEENINLNNISITGIKDISIGTQIQPSKINYLE